MPFAFTRQVWRQRDREDGAARVGDDRFGGEASGPTSAYNDEVDVAFLSDAENGFGSQRLPSQRGATYGRDRPNDALECAEALDDDLFLY